MNSGEGSSNSVVNPSGMQQTRPSPARPYATGNIPRTPILIIEPRIRINIVHKENDNH